MIQYYTAESRFLYKIWNFPFIRLHWLAKKTQEKKKERKNIYALISIKHKNPDNKNIKKKNPKLNMPPCFLFLFLGFISNQKTQENGKVWECIISKSRDFTWKLQDEIRNGHVYLDQ